MARLPRLKIEDQSAWYHVYNRLAGPVKERRLDKQRVRRKLAELMRRYTGAYVCDTAGFVIMGNHYHLVLRTHAYRPLSRAELERRAALLYPRPERVLRRAAQWQRLNRRLFDLSELMRNIDGGFAQWYNRRYGRRGPVWADRFKSALLTDRASVLECLFYVELNPVRAGLCRLPEAWRWGSAYLRERGRDEELVALSELFDRPPEQARELYRRLLYERGALPVRAGQGRISEAELRRRRHEASYAVGVYLERQRFFTDGVLIGTAERVRAQIRVWLEQGRYRRRRHPIEQLGGRLWCLREQRRRRFD